jgi:hypothetical protein
MVSKQVRRAFVRRLHSLLAQVVARSTSSFMGHTTTSLPRPQAPPRIQYSEKAIHLEGTHAHWHVLSQLAPWSLPRPRPRHEWTHSLWTSLSRSPSRRITLQTASMAIGQSTVCVCPTASRLLPDGPSQAMRRFRTRLCICTYGICTPSLHP